MKTVVRRSLRLCAPGFRSGAIPFALASGVAACVAALPALAQSADAKLEPVVVTASRSSLVLSRVLADVTVIGREDIERHGAVSVSDVLKGVPGIQVTRNGGPGTSTSVYIRGGETRFTAVLIDGVRVDTQATGGASWESIPLSQIDHIEILRGPASALYGSDAMSGVVQIFTRKGEGGVRLDAGVGLGSHHTDKFDATLSGTSGPLDFSVGAAFEHSEGYSATVPANPAAAPTANADKDGYRSRSANARFGIKFSDAHRVEVAVLDSHIRSDYDSFSASPNDLSIHDLQTVRGLWTAQWTPNWKSSLSAAQSEDSYVTTPSAYNSLTRVHTYAWQNDLAWGEHSLQALLEQRRDDLENDLGNFSPVSGQRIQNALGLGYGWRRADKAVQLQVRQDHNSDYGNHVTGSLAGGMDVASGLRLKSSVGTGFRAPTFYQQYGAYGSTVALAPETSRNLEVGLQKTWGRSLIGATVFRNRFRDLITFGPQTLACRVQAVGAFGCYANIARATITGLTVEGRTTVLGLNASGSIDFLSAKNDDNDKHLARRAKRHAALQLDKELGAATLGVQAIFSGKRFDDVANTRVLGGYTLLNLDAQYRFADDWRVLARLDNVLDKEYRTAHNYNVTPRSLFVGVRWSPKL
ncbi:MAG: hypothetical protein RLZZ618_1886 [Pseudomonadota bacterium]|jgi:vitamin B12 transporter